MTATGTIASSAISVAYISGLRTSCEASSTIAAVDLPLPASAMLAQAPRDVLDADDGVVDHDRDARPRARRRRSR